VKMNNLTNGLVATLLLASPIAGAETEYPAADFKPKVIYQDVDSSKSAPASAKQAKPVVEATEADSKYPATNFEPKVLYKDADYKPSKFTGTASTSTSTASERTQAADTEVSAPVKAEDNSMMTYLLGLIVVAVAGFIFLGKREPKAKVSQAPVYTSHASGLSGVARYLRKNNMIAATGVARYLESRAETEKEKVATSGVEKYLEKQAKSAKEAAAQAGTGVEKYMRNRG
jgi:hypothetical protein